MYLSNIEANAFFWQEVYRVPELSFKRACIGTAVDFSRARFPR